MSVPSRPDRSLLDRLNALKPSSISLGPPETRSTRPAPAAAGDGAALAASSGTAAPVPREDALAARLKTLRDAHAQGGERSGRHGDRPQQQPAGGAPETETDVAAVTAPPGDDETGLPFFDDDEAVNNLLLDLAAEGLGDEVQQDGEDEADRFARGGGNDTDEDEHGILPLPDVPASLHGSEAESEDADSAKQVEDLLRSLAGAKLEGDAVGGPQKEAADADDSDGEAMGREMRRVLEQARDEAELSKKEGDDDDDDDPLGLPAVPTRLVDPPAGRTDGDALGLPSAPTKSLPKRGDDDDISARLAALRGLRGKAAGLGQTDAFGLPSAPTFCPGEEGGVLKRGHFGHGRQNYTDADQKAWCIVCLEDAAVRCLGCADNPGGGEADQNNAYCAGCWQDMHVGPAASFDARGHRRVPLVR